jgi:hypothetical protein
LDSYIHGHKGQSSSEYKDLGNNSGNFGGGRTFKSQHLNENTVGTSLIKS